MDPFTENILARARERQRLIGGHPEPHSSGPKHVSISEPNLTKPKLMDPKEVASDSNLLKKFGPQFKESSSEGNITRFSRQNSTTRVSSEMSPSPHSLNTLNVQNDNFNMEIKITSADNIRVEVQIEEQHSPDSVEAKNDGGLRADAKNRLNRLGKLYAGGEDAEISSPIHRTEGKFLTEDRAEIAVKPDENKSKKGLSKLADLAQNINQWEDDLSSGRKNKSTTISKKPWKPPAPQPPVSEIVGAVRSSKKVIAPSPPKVVAESPKKENKMTPKQLNWDKQVLDTLESQGFTRTTSSSRLVYKYDSQDKNVKTANTAKVLRAADKENVIVEESEPEEAKPKPKSPTKQNIRTAAIADRAALFESSPNKAAAKDPALLSVSERKALFEKNKGTALVPKAPFAMATPIKSNIPRRRSLKSPAPQPPVAAKIEPKPGPLKTDVANKHVEPSVVVQEKGVVKKLVASDAEVEAKPVVAQGAGIAHTMAALFEGKTTISQEQIESSVREQRKKEMDMLLNRFNRNKEVVEEADEADDLAEATEETAMLTGKQTSKIVPPPPQPPVPMSGEKRRSGGNKRCSKADSPKVAAILSDVKRIKVTPNKDGRLYPCLTDIESTTETENETEDNLSQSPDNSSFEESIAESDDINTSFGRDILRTVCKNETPIKRQIFEESTSSGMSDLLDGSDDYINEALAYDDARNVGPTPPKHCRQSPTGPQPSDSFNYKSYSEFKSPAKSAITPRKSVDLPAFVVDGDNVLPLKHTVSVYRRQQSTTTTPIRQISRQPLVEEESENHPNEEREVQTKMRELRNEVNKQTLIISQTSQALNLCNSTPEFMGSTEQVEAERVLLVATHRRQAALHELQRLEVEGCLRPQGKHSRNVPLEKGTLTISKIVLPLKQKYVTALAAAGGKGHHVVCLIKCGEHVVPTQLVSTVATNIKNPDLELNVPGTIKLDNIYSDFTITFEVYCLQAQEEILPHEVKYHINKKTSSKLTPKKGKHDSRLVRPHKESPGGPQAVRSPTFAQMGYVVFSVQAINKKHWSLNNTPSMSPLEGTVEMCIFCELAVSMEHHGFLTMFEDVSGFGAWHRRWCVLKGDTMSYWKYPEDEKKMPPINSISLKNCVTKQVGPVSREICARMHTFLIERERVAHLQDKNTLVMVCKGNKTVIRHLLSADTKEERIEWCNKLNGALTALRMWGDKKN